ncbi:MAG: hypothetical protein ACJAYX_003913 [Planctomycetota bacterium]
MLSGNKAQAVLDRIGQFRFVDDQWVVVSFSPGAKGRYFACRCDTVLGHDKRPLCPKAQRAFFLAARLPAGGLPLPH